jgi:hypothetical protein
MCSQHNNNNNKKEWQKKRKNEHDMKMKKEILERPFSRI